MSHPTEDELVDLAVGDDSVAASVSAHVAGCDACAATVAELRRTAALVATAPAYAAWQTPGDAVWGRIADEMASDEMATDDRGAGGGGPQGQDTVSLTTDEPTSDDLPPTGPVRREPATPPTGTVRREPATPHTGDELAQRRAGRDERRGRARRLSVGWGAGLAAASLAIGLLAGRAIWQPDTPVQPVAQVALATLDTKQDEGKATVVRSGDGLDLTVATSKPLDAGDGYLEVWLLNADGKRMVSVGVLAPGDKASFPISQTLIDQGYVIVDISREKFDGSPAHSGDSLLRGKLPA
ncbi:anti-sigma factor [Humibacillus xanthopallidus]|uniref:Anti-sigma-K factor rskA n=1 Tax=Humibacillus xanthopallidus TaxID=412689 RepID=A0A543I1K5_9MICO|nr:anti-sigma factor [Humibacillus xanthopallidus]TQM64468.1 anti-sigma-K factor rskA [Humibacillus xanthopallidus]